MALGQRHHRRRAGGGYALLKVSGKGAVLKGVRRELSASASQGTRVPESVTTLTRDAWSVAIEA